jgi:hypothetical protein
MMAANKSTYIISYPWSIVTKCLFDSISVGLLAANKKTNLISYPGIQGKP